MIAVTKVPVARLRRRYMDNKDNRATYEYLIDVIRTSGGPGLIRCKSTALFINFF